MAFPRAASTHALRKRLLSNKARMAGSSKCNGIRHLQLAQLLLMLSGMTVPSANDHLILQSESLVICSHYMRCALTMFHNLLRTSV